MREEIPAIANELRTLRQGTDSIRRASSEQIPYPRRIADALGALRALVTDQTPTGQLESDLQVVHGIAAALVGETNATRVIQQLPGIRRSVATDVEAAFEGDPSATSYGQVIACYPSIRAISTYRLAHAFHAADERFVARVMAEEAHGKTGIDINPGAAIGHHFFIDHGTGVVIGETCRIGNRVKLYHGVTLGAFSNKHGREDVGRKRHPTLEDDVTVYPNATILGGDTVVGLGSVIGGNAWLTESVPPYTKVTIESPRLQRHQKPPPHFGEGI